MHLRPARASEDVPFLRAMLYEAFCWRPDAPRAPLESVLAERHVARYLDGWGRPGDVGSVAEGDGRPVGACWFRLFPPDDMGYGFVAEDVPELTLAVASDERGRGVGTRLLDEIVAAAWSHGHARLSLSVEEDNPALRLYERAGFARVGRVGNAWTMVTVRPA